MPLRHLRGDTYLYIQREARAKNVCLGDKQVKTQVFQEGEGIKYVQYCLEIRMKTENYLLNLAT